MSDRRAPTGVPLAELFRALASLCEPPGPAQAEMARALRLPGGWDAVAHTGLFVLQLPPYAAVYLGGEGARGGEAVDRVAGFWRALRLAPPAEPDHLAALLSLYGALLEREAEEPDRARRALGVQARRALLFEHLLCWVPLYTRAVRTIGSSAQAAWAALLDEALLAEARGLGAPSALPAHLREAPAPAVVEEGGEDRLSALLTPVRSGLVLTHADLGRAARRLGLGLRLGERRLALSALLGQEAEATLGWLAREALAWAADHRRREPALGGVARFWASRAQASAEWLDEARLSAGADAAVAPEGARRVGSPG